MSTPKQKRIEHFARLRAQGVNVLSFKAPCCGEELEVAAALEGSTAHTMIDCVTCSAVLMITVTDSAVTAKVADLKQPIS
jgi:transcription elongation factor Elf1